VKFGLFYNPMVPKRTGELGWDEGQERQKYREMFEQIQLADRLGFDYVFLGEHHFSAEYAHNSATEVLLGALASTTKNIRLGTGIVHASHNHPVRIAERIATIDLLSDGRAEFGYGGGGPEEVAPFLGPRAGDRSARALAAGQIAADILSSEGLYPGVDNEFFTIPPVNIVPKAFQKPHPPLWTSVVDPRQTENVALQGLGQLLLSVMGPEMVGEVVETYWDALKTGDIRPVGRGINPAVFTFAAGLIAPTKELAMERGYEGVQFMGFGLSGGAQAIIGVDNANLWDSFQAWRNGGPDIRTSTTAPPFVLEMGAQYADSPGTILDSVEGAIESIRAFEATNVDGLLFNQMFGNTKHEHIMESIELLGTMVFPEFRERSSDHDRWRQEHLKLINQPVVSSV
jgi:alkanesulfonate monooxygenase SsuD/methylene tetrahydromethanopterin reductase-like flavin-dependent oxidoreductase (luciferase family)